MRFLATALAIVMAGTLSAAADPLEGTWLTAPDDNNNRGIIQVDPCPGNGAALCGTLVGALDGSGARLEGDEIGTRIISDMVPQGGGSYRGKVYAPDRDRTYNSRLELSGNSLSVSGCVLGVCRDGGTWTRR